MEIQTKASEFVFRLAQDLHKHSPLVIDSQTFTIQPKCGLRIPNIQFPKKQLTEK